jgi:hypothetical protein
MQTFNDSQAHLSIYRTELGSHPIGDALDDEHLFELCRDYGDAYGSLKFIVSRRSSAVYGQRTQGQESGERRKQGVQKGEDLERPQPKRRETDWTLVSSDVPHSDYKRGKTVTHERPPSGRMVGTAELAKRAASQNMTHPTTFKTARGLAEANSTQPRPRSSNFRSSLLLSVASITRPRTVVGNSGRWDTSTMSSFRSLMDYHQGPAPPRLLLTRLRRRLVGLGYE